MALDELKCKKKVLKILNAFDTNTQNKIPTT